MSKSNYTDQEKAMLERRSPSPEELITMLGGAKNPSLGVKKDASGTILQAERTKVIAPTIETAKTGGELAEAISSIGAATVAKDLPPISAEERATLLKLIEYQIAQKKAALASDAQKVEVAAREKLPDLLQLALSPGRLKLALYEFLPIAVIIAIVIALGALFLRGCIREPQPVVIAGWNSETNLANRIAALESISNFSQSNMVAVHNDLMRADQRFAQDEYVSGVLVTNVLVQRTELSNIVGLLQRAAAQAAQTNTAVKK